MAITSAALQAEFGAGGNDVQVLQAFEPSQGSLQQWYVNGRGVVPGRCRMVTTTASDNAATQAAAVLVALRAN